MIGLSPIKKTPKPAARRRETYASAEDYRKLEIHFGNRFWDRFWQLLQFVWLSGCRAQEVVRIEARHLDPERSRVVFPASEAKGRRRARIIRLTPEAMEMALARAHTFPIGPIFRNHRNRAWVRHALKCRFARLRDVLGRQSCLTEWRHGYGQSLLEAGIDMTVVAELMGHSSTRMISEVYSHMGAADAHLYQQLQKARPSIGLPAVKTTVSTSSEVPQLTR